jgi:hypothetical protein
VSPAFRGTDLFATLIVLGLATGLSLRRNRAVHPKIMGSCFLADLGLVVYLEATRGAVAIAGKFESRILSFHVGVAVATLVLYVLLGWSGRRILSGQGGIPLHGKFAALFVLCRLATYVTAFLIPRSV